MPASLVISRQNLFRVLFLAGMWFLLAMGTGHVHALMQRAILTRVQPEYPALAIRMHICGTVQLHVTVVPDGTVRDVHAISGHAFLQGPAEEAVRRWRFSKAPETSEVKVEVRFAPPTSS